MKVKCPHCNKEIDTSLASEMKKEEVLEEIDSQTHSISSLSRKLEIKRSTLRYYLSSLISENKIVEERLENLAGRPTILKIKINEKVKNNGRN